jgi:hypothetical protein
MKKSSTIICLLISFTTFLFSANNNDSIQDLIATDINGDTITELITPIIPELRIKDCDEKKSKIIIVQDSNFTKTTRLIARVVFKFDIANNLTDSGYLLQWELSDDIQLFRYDNDVPIEYQKKMYSEILKNSCLQMDYYWKPDLIKRCYKDYDNTILYMIPIIVTPLSQEEFIKEGFMKRQRNEYYTEEHYKRDIERWWKFYQYNY